MIIHCSKEDEWQIINWEGFGRNQLCNNCGTSIGFAWSKLSNTTKNLSHDQSVYGHDCNQPPPKHNSTGQLEEIFLSLFGYLMTIFQPYLLFCIERKDAHVDDERKWTQSLCYDIPVSVYGKMVIKPSRWSICWMQIKKMCHGQLNKT